MQQKLHILINNYSKDSNFWPKFDGLYCKSVNTVFGFQNFQKSVKYGPIYFNKKWSAEIYPLNWSCPLFLESAKLEFHCITLLFCGSVIPRRRKKRGCFIFCERWKSLAFSSRSFMRKPDFVITNTGPLIV